MPISSLPLTLRLNNFTQIRYTLKIYTPAQRKPPEGIALCVSLRDKKFLKSYSSIISHKSDTR